MASPSSPGLLWDADSRAPHLRPLCQWGWDSVREDVFLASVMAAGSQPTFWIDCWRWPWCMITGTRTIVTSPKPPGSSLIQKQWSWVLPFHSSSVTVVTPWLISLSHKLLWPHINSLQIKHRREHARIYLTWRLTDFKVMFSYCKCPYSGPAYGGLRKGSLGIYSHLWEKRGRLQHCAPPHNALPACWELQISESELLDSFHGLSHSVMLVSCRRRNFLSEGASGQGIKRVHHIDGLPASAVSSNILCWDIEGLGAHVWLSFWSQVKCSFKSTV